MLNAYACKNVVCCCLLLLAASVCSAQQQKTAPKQPANDALLKGFQSPPDVAKPRIYWFWIYNRVTREGITRDLEAFKDKGISAVTLICTGGYGGKEPLLGVDFPGEEWRALFRHAVKEANRLHIQFGFNMAGGWTMMGPWVTKDNAMKKIVFADTLVAGPARFAAVLPHPVVADDYYHSIKVQAFRLKDNTKTIDERQVIELSTAMQADGRLVWDVPPGNWVILRSGYTLTGEFWSKWKAYPEGDTFKGGEGYEIDYLSVAALDAHFNVLGKLVLDEAKKAGGHIDYLWSDSWECGKLSWTQDFAAQFKKFRGYDLFKYLPALAGYTVIDTTVTARFRDDFQRTIQDCIAENFYGHFAELCHSHGLEVGNEAGGPNDIPSQDVLKNFSTSDIVAGEFWVNGTRNAEGGYNKNPALRLNLKQTATAAHVYGKKQAEAEAFTEQQRDGTHWTLGPFDLKPYANDAFCEGINRFMLHAATCQPPSDGMPGYVYCAGQHFTPNITWWKQSGAFFSYLSRCQYMLQQGRFVGDVCFYLGERPPLLVPPKYNVPGLGAGYDCDYANPDVLLTRMEVSNGRIVLPDGMSYRMLVLQQCVSPVPEIAKQVGNYQQLQVSAVPLNQVSLPIMQKLRKLIDAGATVIGPPPVSAASLHNYPACDVEVQKIVAEIWGNLDGKTCTERRYGKGRIIWGKTPREVLLADGVQPDCTFTGQEQDPGRFDYTHRRSAGTDIYFIANRTNQPQKADFTFRVANTQPEIWNAVTGEVFAAPLFTQQNGTTTLPLELDVFSAYFIVFRTPVGNAGVQKATANFPVLTPLQTLNDAWQVCFDTAWGGPATTTFPILTSWTASETEGIRYYSGTATYNRQFNTTFAISKDTANRRRLFLDLGAVKEVADVYLNGIKLATLWCKPWVVEITGVVKETGNTLTIDVANLWANRVVHDLGLPVEKRLTKTHEVFRFDMLNPQTPIIESGLLGPVRILQAAGD